MYFIGVDIGGTGIKVGLTDEMGNIISSGDCPTYVDLGYERIISDMSDKIIEVSKNAGIDIKDIESIGIGIPGVADTNGKVYYATNLKWTNVPLGELVRKKFPGKKVKIENDATVAALAELHIGSMRGKATGILLTLGTGVGGGIIINERVFSGAHGIGSEIGHMIVGENFYDCNCGNNGCLETFASATAIIKYAQKLISEGRESIILEKAENDLSKITARTIFEAYKEKDEVAQIVVKRFVNYLGIGIANLVNVFDPEIFSLGGGVSRAFDLFIDDLRYEVSKHVIFKDVPYGDIVPATLGNDAGIVGAAMLGV